MNRYPLYSLWTLILINLSGLSAARAEAPRLPAPVVDADYYDDGAPSAAKVELGRMLFFDKLLSGNQNISCATCHHPEHGSSDGLALPLGEGPTGLGPDRRPGTTKALAVHGRVPRNSPAIFNLGASEFTRIFHDGRVETDPNGYYEGGFVTPAKWKLPSGLDNALAAQAMFPVTSSHEMAGQKGENPVGDASSLANAAGPGGIWELMAQRLQSVPEYVTLFQDAYPDTVHGASDITYVLAANAIAAFEAHAFRADQSPFDAYLRGDDDALTEQERAGMQLFYGEAGCADCHSGKFQTDHGFHAIAMPQIGPGKGDGRSASYWSASGQEAFLEDFGRGRVTFSAEDQFKFRTPTLRNVALTGPWGHAGAFDTLEAVVRHHLDPISSLRSFDPHQVELPPLGRLAELTVDGAELKEEWMSDPRSRGFALRDTWVMTDPDLVDRIAAANELDPVRLTDEQVAQLVTFLDALTDPRSVDQSDLIPERVPSGLPVED